MRVGRVRSAKGSRGRRRRSLTRDPGGAQDSRRPGAGRTRRSEGVPPFSGAEPAVTKPASRTTGSPPTAVRRGRVRPDTPDSNRFGECDPVGRDAGQRRLRRSGGNEITADACGSRRRGRCPSRTLRRDPARPPHRSRSPVPRSVDSEGWREGRQSPER